MLALNAHVVRVYDVWISTNVYFASIPYAQCSFISIAMSGAVWKKKFAASAITEYLIPAQFPIVFQQMSQSMLMWYGFLRVASPMAVECHIEKCRKINSLSHYPFSQ